MVRDPPMGVDPHGRSGPCPPTNGSVLIRLHLETLDTLSQLSHLPVSSVREGRKKKGGGLYGSSNPLFLISAHLCSLWMELYGQISRQRLPSIVGCPIILQIIKKAKSCPLTSYSVIDKIQPALRDSNDFRIDEVCFRSYYYY